MVREGWTGQFRTNAHSRSLKNHASELNGRRGKVVFQGRRVSPAPHEIRQPASHRRPPPPPPPPPHHQVSFHPRVQAVASSLAGPLSTWMCCFRPRHSAPCGPFTFSNNKKIKWSEINLSRRKKGLSFVIHPVATDQLMVTLDISVCVCRYSSNLYER